MRNLPEKNGSPATVRPNPSVGTTAWLAAISLSGTCLILFSYANHGPYISPDSVYYISLARNLMEGNGYLTLYDSPTGYSPPGYPVLLALFSFLVLDPLDTAGGINAFILGLTAFIAGYWLAQRIGSRFLSLWGCFAIAWAVPLRHISSSAWSEPAFILFTTLSLIWTERYFSTTRRATLILAALFAALACMTRYAGVALVIATLMPLARQRGAGLREKSKRIGLYLAIAMTPLGLWLARNMLALGTPTGPRPPARVTLQDNLCLMIETLTTWWQNSPWFTAVFQPVATAMTIAVLLGLMILVGRALFARRPAAQDRPDRHVIPVFGAFGFVYLAFMLWAATTTRLDPLHHRLLSPAYIPLLVLILCALDRLFTLCRERGSFSGGMNLKAILPKLSVLAVVAILSLWAGAAGHAIVKETATKKTIDNYGYRSIPWRESETLRYLQQNQPPRIYSNIPFAVYINSDRLHKPVYRRLPKDIDTLEQWSDNPKIWLKDTWIIWLFRGHPKEQFNYDASYLSNMQGLEPVTELSDGVILRVR